MRVRLTENSRKNLQMERWLPWIFGNLLILILFIRDIKSFENGLIANSAYWGRDFINVWTSGKILLAGKIGIIYDVPAYYAFAQGLFGAIGEHNYSYPPFVLPLMVPFALLPYPIALAAWLGLTGWLFVYAAAPWWRAGTGLPAWMVAITPAGLVNIWTGHYGFLLGALALLGWRNLDRKPALAGLFFGLMAIKPHLAILIPLVLLLRGEWKAIWFAALTVLALIMGSLMLFGIEPWREYLTVTIGVQSAMINAGGAFFRLMSTSAATSMLQLGASAPVAGLIQAAVAMAGVGMVAIAARTSSTQDTALLAATATFLVLPYAFNYDLTVSAMGAALLMYRTDLSVIDTRVATWGFMAAQIGMVLAALFSLPGLPLLLLGLAIVQFRYATRHRRSQTRGGLSPSYASDS
jgi:hypothetical protein